MSTEKKLNWAILVTGWGRNAKDTIENYQQGLLNKSDIKLLVYQSLPCGAAEAAENAGIETLRLERKDYASVEDYQQVIIKELNSRKIDYVLLLSFKYIIREEMLKAFPNRIINIHPSLFPSFLATTTAIQEALAYGVRISGITTHIIDDKIDEGTILCQEPIRFEENETFESVYPKFAATAPKLILDTISLIEQKHFKD
ncbi:formyltransferase family protein [Muriicola sp. Z0-33]|uniref:formyltransferase family protein n=1 Tax=Muriicola sp. Z0-33 TaxID=2816957 RepID=UPI002238D523|nr:formyltransferase family protein [Muriicola sp. Z0-33]MCW5515610.1 phosphoribosylglycinamide formyltransferase [Muriicola sp. Z0-33]